MREFSQKSHLDQHNKRKTPCVKDDQLLTLINTIVEKKVEEKLREIQNDTIKITENSEVEESETEETELDDTELQEYESDENETDENESDESELDEIELDDSELEDNDKIVALDLFCGCGGMSKGLHDAGIEILAGIDIWEKAIESYKKNYNHLGICEDLTKLPPQKFQTEYNKDKIKIDLIVGGPPCQGMSISGKRDKNDPRNSLFMEFVKYLDFFKPKAFMMENVIGILSMKNARNEKIIDIIMSYLNKNYNCRICKLYASDFEVPQNRRRVIIIGIRKDLNINPSNPYPILTEDQRIPVKNILIPKDQVDKSYFLSQKALDGIKKKKEKSKAEGKGFGAQYLDFDKPSYTIPARYWKDGYDALVKYNDNEIRRLTILELKRIQSFPDSYKIEGSKKDIIMQIGNAVACRFAYHLGKHIINMLN
jgi:DNA (cytosine-5)-methyltransferase 1